MIYDDGYLTAERLNVFRSSMKDQPVATKAAYAPYGAFRDVEGAAYGPFARFVAAAEQCVDVTDRKSEGLVF